MLLAVGFFSLLLVGGAIALDCRTNGISLGKLQGGGAQGEVFVVNASTIQILGFSAQGPTTFAFNPAGPVNDIFVWQKDNTLKRLSSPISSLSNSRLVMNVPGGDIKASQTFSAQSGGQTASVNIPGSISPPQPLQLNEGINGWIYSVKTGPITVLDTKTLILPNFSFQGNKPPDGWVFAGKYSPEDGKVHGAFGEKALVRGHDTANSHTPLKEFWDGSKTIIVDLGKSQTVCDLQFIGVYCYAVGVDFGHLDLAGKISRDVPPHIPRIA